MTPNGTSAVAERSAPSAPGRIDWVDYAKGICIVMVVMMHSVLGVETGRRPDRLHASGCHVRQAVPDAGFLPDLGPVPVGRDRPRLAHLSRPQGRALCLFLRAVGDDPVRLQGAVLCRRDQLDPCRLPVSGILHRAVRHAVVHLSAAGLLRRHQGHEADAAAAIWGIAALLEMAHIVDRLDRDRRILRALRLFLFRLFVRRLRVRAVRPCAGASRAGARGAGALGPHRRRPGEFQVAANGR